MRYLFIFWFVLLLLLNPLSADVSRADSAGASIPDYKQRLTLRIASQRFFPPHAPSGTTVIAFSLDRDGKLVSESVAKSSGSAALDAAAMTIVKRSFPYKPPDNFEGGQFTIPLVFRQPPLLHPAHPK